MYKHVPLLIVLTVPLLASCHAATPMPIGTFVNQTDPTQTLEIKLDPAQTPNVLMRISIETGVNKYFGKSVGTYTLKTQRENTSGQFVWAVSPRDGKLTEVWFKADTGPKWTISVRTGGSLVDSNGAVWKRRSA